MEPEPELQPQPESQPLESDTGVGATASSSSSATTATTTTAGALGAAGKHLVLRGRWVLVTGGGRGIGRAVAVTFAREGAKVALCARTPNELQQTAGLCRDAGAADVSVHVADLADADEVEQLAAELLQKHGGVDVLVNNAGCGHSGSALEGDPDQWEEMVAVNMLAPMRLTRRLAPPMAVRGAGLIINIGSIAALEGMAGAGAAFAASKFGLRGWSLSTYQALRYKNIKVVLINPAFVDTQMSRAYPGTMPERMITPDDVCEAVLLAVRTSSACVVRTITDCTITEYCLPS
eukprot:SAG22_NODE_1039_length_5888_cov_4.141302_5_plen_292_part_00